MRAKKAQLQIMENAFILLVIFIILIIAFVFVVSFQKAEQKDKEREFLQLELIKKSRILNFLPEMQCSDNNNLDPDCYDLFKIESFTKTVNEHKFYYQPLLGNIKITIKRYDPSPDINKWFDTWEVYDFPKEPFNGIMPIEFPVLLKDSVNSTNYFGIIFLGVYE